MYGPQIIELRKQGFSYLQITKTLGCSKANISYHCSKKGGHHAFPHKKKVIKLPEGKEGFLKWLLEAGVRKSDIADALGIVYPDVLLFAKRYPYTLSRKDLSNYEKVKLRRRNLKMLAVAYKGGQCAYCGYSRSLQAFDFHHLDPTQKSFCIASGRSWAKIKKEVSKTILLCANCHREEHDTYFLSKGENRKEKQGYSNPKVS